MLVDIGLHTEKMQFDEAIDFLMEHTGYNPTTAKSEVLMYSLSPGYFLSYLLGRHLLEQLKERTPISEKEFHDKVLYSGNIPYWFLRDHILANH